MEFVWKVQHCVTECGGRGHCPLLVILLVILEYVAAAWSEGGALYMLCQGGALYILCCTGGGYCYTLFGGRYFSLVE